ncbi:acyl-CoA dehydrogenase family protein [Thalassomonas viridans]|uniref:Acyl-CoA dehydrogenase family protein n=1 Tax=Thalassomonas viridans TaxID=137584 RepID=A0AAF0C7Z0_9GAMM|nr:acyl-CoA dehydrogenase family protein [Thalassomonas viridans]WDE03660.1 acyl-CoA dehydrogenase family protein [Thalassomonas viridans]
MTIKADPISTNPATGQDDNGQTISGGPLSREVRQVERTMPNNAGGRDDMRQWLHLGRQNAFTRNTDFRHSLRYHFPQEAEHGRIAAELTDFGALVPTALDDAVTSNDFRFNNPRIEPYNKIGDRIDKIVHHPDYADAGDIIYGTDIVKKLTTLGGLKEGMAFYFLANHVGEAGHLCPVVCNYETARVLHLVEDFPGREDYIRKLEIPSYRKNFTSSQFLTEVQGGSDVGANDTRAWQSEEGHWYIRGEKWFCSNADAELMVISARRSLERKGTKGLSMFLIPALKPDGSRNHFTMRRLKEKLGTRALASAEIDFHDAYAIPLGANFNLMLEKVVHHSRLSLPVAVLGFATRAYQFALDFAHTRKAFRQTIIDFPLVKENLAHVKADITACLAGAFALLALQDELDTAIKVDEDLKMFTRLMVNISKSVISKRTVDNIHHCIDGIGGNGAIENTSGLPRLLRDSLILENWEGAHNTLYVQVLRDIHRYRHDEIYLKVMTGKIAALPDPQDKEKQLAQQALARLALDIRALHHMPHDLQTLTIKDIITDMANLFYYVSLVQEGGHQQQSGQKGSKLASAELFYRIMLAREPEKASQAKDQTYLALCAAVIEA